MVAPNSELDYPKFCLGDCVHQSKWQQRQSTQMNKQCHRWEYEPEIMVPNTDDHVFFADNNGVDDDRRDDDEQEMTMEVGGVLMRPCLMNLVEVGWHKLKKMNVKKMRMAADSCT